MKVRESIGWDARPWTVRLLVGWGLIGALIGLVSDRALDVNDLLPIAFTALFTWAYWTGRTWAFSLAFAFSVLAGLFFIGYLIFSPERLPGSGSVFWVINVVGTIYLVRHPATKRFLGLDDRPRFRSGPPDRGGRLAQATAISLFGILAIAVPILWTIGKLEGPALAAAAVVCVGSGIAVLLLGLPAKTSNGA